MPVVIHHSDSLYAPDRSLNRFARPVRPLLGEKWEKRGKVVRVDAAARAVDQVDQVNTQTDVRLAGVIAASVIKEIVRPIKKART